MRVTVVIPARDAAPHLPAALDALAAQDLDEPWEVIVVDNGSRDSTATIAEEHPLRPRVLRRDRGDGPGSARNDGVAAAQGTVIAFTDADCRPTPGWLRCGLLATRDAELVQGAVATPPGEDVGPYDHTVSIGSEYGLYETANLFVRREWFERVGGFLDWLDTGDGRPFGEDVWFAWRLRREGARTAFCADALVHHAVIPRGLRDFLDERSRLRHFPALVRHVPELREVFLYRRFFLNHRSAMLDVALLAAAAAAATRRPWLLAGVLPYAAKVRSAARPWPRPVRVAAVQVAADVVGHASLLRGALQSRTPLF